MATIEIPEETMELASRLAERLHVSVEELLRSLLDVLGSYSGDLVEWALDLRVRREHMPDALFEELVFYGVEAKKGVVDRVLNMLKARGRFELEHLELDPETGSIELEMVALEGSDLEADRIRVGWSPRGVIVEALYYLEEDTPPPILRKSKDPKIDVAYLPDEHAILVTATGKSLKEVPPIHVMDRIALG
ncbi:MAG: hypothetical protein F7C35_05895 [Desulfurococcales archaeon]|nr:hypothetical protein [Desulfurococcales archaeon]